MSWLARSIANTLKFNDEDEDNNHNETNKDVHKQTEAEHNLLDSPSSPSSPGRSVKEDISELTKTLTRQFWGVASFLAPPPPSDHSQVSDSNPNESSRGGGAQASDSEASEQEAISGLRSDFAEIGGKFRSGISKLSSNIAVSEITKMASNFLQLGPEEDNYDSVRGAVGVTDEVVAFVRDIAMHPETWLDFPLPEDDYDEDFDMSDAQQEHALAVERLAPRLAALRIELCPGYMSEDCFWKIYFVLLHPRLDRNDAEVLSTPQIVKARASLTHELQNRIKAKPEESSPKGFNYSQNITNSPHEEALSVPFTAQSATPTAEPDFATDKHAVQSIEIQIIDKSIINEEPVSKNKDQNSHSSSSSKDIEINDEDNGDDWLKEESSEAAFTGGAAIAMDNEEDVSFSDLEEDDGDGSTNKKMTYCSDSSTKDSPDWVQLSRNSEQVSVRNPETKESNDWLNVDDIDVA